jgi:hypothetical protein
MAHGIIRLHHCVRFFGLRSYTPLNFRTHTVPFISQKVFTTARIDSLFRASLKNIPSLSDGWNNLMSDPPDDPPVGINDKKDEVGFALDMALKCLGRISGRLHFLAQNQFTAQAVKAIYSQEDY